MSEPEVPIVYDDADDLYRTAELVLEHINLTYQEFSHDLPARQFITFGGRGDTVHDCEQVSVSIEQLYSGMPGNQANEPQPCDGPTTVVFVVEVVRCIPTPSGKQQKAPSAEAISNMARVQARDAALLMKGGMNAVEAQDFAGGIADVSAGAPNGAYQAMVLNLIMAVYPGIQ